MFVSHLISPVFVLRWVDQPNATDVILINEELLRASQRVGGKLVYIGVIPDGISPPPGSVRKDLQDGLLKARGLCASVHLVVEGGGLRSTLIRAILAGIMFDETRRTTSLAKVHVHATLREALVSANEVVPLDVEQVLLGSHPNQPASAQKVG